MAKRQHITPQQFTQMLERAGISPNTIKARIRAELTWSQLVRGKFSASLQVGESDVAKALRARNETQADVVGYIYTLYPIMLVVPQGSSAAVMEAKRREAENLRSRFVSCNEGLAFARALRDVAVREPIARSSADLRAATARAARQHAGRPPDHAGRDAAGPADVRAVRQEGEQGRFSGQARGAPAAVRASGSKPRPRSSSKKSANRR